MLRKGGHVYVLDFFVKVPSGATAPNKYRTKEAGDVQQTNFLMAGGVSVEDRSKRAETVRPQHDEHCECQFVCDSALSPKSEME